MAFVSGAEAASDVPGWAVEAGWGGTGGSATGFGFFLTTTPFNRLFTSFFPAFGGIRLALTLDEDEADGKAGSLACAAACLSASALANELSDGWMA